MCVPALLPLFLSRAAAFTVESKGKPSPGLSWRGGRELGWDVAVESVKWDDVYMHVETRSCTVA